MHTTSYWFTIPKDLLILLPYAQSEIIDGLTGLAYTLHHLASMLLMSDAHDIDRCIGDKSGEWFVRQGGGVRSISNSSQKTNDTTAIMVDAFDPTVFIFDAYPGGIGFSALLYEQHDRLLESSLSLIRNCPCSHGCPSCVGPTLEVGPMAKETVLAILDVIIEKP
jgi:DEAD/DEAH box helicase domain-containing protein